MIIECDTCKKPFEYHRKKKYCSPKCRRSSFISSPIDYATCKGCGKFYIVHPGRSKRVARNSERKKKYLKEYRQANPQPPRIRCIQPLSSKIAINQCELTGVMFVAKKKTSKYAPLIRKQLKSIRDHAQYNPLKAYLYMCPSFKELICAECRAVYLNNNSKSKYCSRKCNKRQSTRIEKARAADSENIDPFIVFEKHNWKCNGCGKHTPLDHIIPLSKGGCHKYNNVQLLCRQCNMEKSDKVMPINIKGEGHEPPCFRLAHEPPLTKKILATNFHKGSLFQNETVTKWF